MFLNSLSELLLNFSYDAYVIKFLSEYRHSYKMFNKLYLASFYAYGYDPDDSVLSLRELKHCLSFIFPIRIPCEPSPSWAFRG